MSLCTEMYGSMREGEQKNASATREGKRAGHRKTERKRTEEWGRMGKRKKLVFVHACVSICVGFQCKSSFAAVWSEAAIIKQLWRSTTTTTTTVCVSLSLTLCFTLTLCVCVIFVIIYICWILHAACKQATTNTITYQMKYISLQRSCLCFFLSFSFVVKWVRTNKKEREKQTINNKRSQQRNMGFVVCAEHGAEYNSIALCIHRAFALIQN